MFNVYWDAKAMPFEKFIEEQIGWARQNHMGMDKDLDAPGAASTCMQF